MAFVVRLVFAVFLIITLIFTVSLQSTTAKPGSLLSKLKDKAKEAVQPNPAPQAPPAQPAAQIRDKWAVIVGISRFKDKSIRPIRFASQNAIGLLTMLIDPAIGRFGQDHVTIATDEQAIKSNLDMAFGETWLLKKALPNDMVFIYLCTRAKPSADGSDLILFTADTDPKSVESGFSLKTLLGDLHRRIQSKQIVCLLDVSPFDDKESADGVSLDAIANETKVTIMSASKPGAPSLESSVNQCSYFIEYLAEGLRAGSGTLSLGAIAQYVADNVQKQAQTELNKEQKPVIAVATDNTDVLKTSLGVLVKSSLPPKAAKIGHPVDSLAVSRPDLVPNRPAAVAGSRSKPSTQAKSKEKEKDEEDDDDDVAMGSVNFGPYMTKMKKDIQAKWNPPKGMEQRRVVAVFSIMRDGTIKDPTIVDSSGTDKVDDSAMEALKAASPLDPLPAGSPSFVQIRYQFDWKVR